MKRVIIFTLLSIILISGLTSCSLYHMQTPRTTPVGSYSGGIGLTGTTSEGNTFAIPGLWVRTGLAPNFDIGIHSWGLGMKLDGKYALSDYLAIGAGGGGAFMGAFVYNVEGSIYAGIPLGPLYPYGAARINRIGITASVEDTLIGLHGDGFSAVGGAKLKLGSTFGIYLEGGAWMPLTDNDNEAIPLFGIGLSVGQ